MRLKKEENPELFSNLPIGSGGIVYWNPSGSALPTTSGILTNPVTDLAHELFHAEDANFGKLDNRKECDVKRSEWQAVYKENLLRLQMGLPLRTHYKKVADDNNRVLGGIGPAMLLNGQIEKPSWYY